MFLYRSVSAYGEAEQSIQRSRFIARVQPVADYEMAKSFVREIKARYREATHNVPAIICGSKQELQWASDDGEPQGTAGTPILRLAAQENLTNLAIVVTRYFGGIKLGTGGLVRAYTAVARAGLEAACPCAVYAGLLRTYEAEYAHLSSLQRMAAEGQYEIVAAEYTEHVTLRILMDQDDAERIDRSIQDATAGRCRCIGEVKQLLRKRLKGGGNGILR